MKIGPGCGNEYNSVYIFVGGCGVSSQICWNLPHTETLICISTPKMFVENQIIVTVLLFTVSIQDVHNSKHRMTIRDEEFLVLPTHAFKDYPSFWEWEQFIDISSTNLSTIEPEAFLNVSIDRIDITYNPLEVLQMGMFVNVYLRCFYLNNNKIKSIQIGTFDKIFPYVKDGSYILSLEGNRLQSISKGVFNNLEVEDLYLQRNLIKSIEKGSFDHMPKLEFLYLKGNLLETIDAGIFQNLGNTLRIFLNDNNISYVNPQAFENYTELQLNLKGNNVHMTKGYFTNSRDIVKFVI